MERWAGKVAIVTGASSGIGIGIVTAMVNHGVKVVAIARRLELLEQHSAKFGKDKYYPMQCDLRKEEEILNVFKWVEKQFGGVDILVNNAGVIVLKPVIESTTEDYRKVMDTNVIAAAICARETAQSLKKRNAAGHIINISSIAGLYAEAIHQPIGMYGASKYAMNALSTELHHEMIKCKLNVKVTSVNPGPVLTDMLTGILPPEVDLKKIPMLKVNDIVAAVMYTLGTPEGVEVPEIVLMPQDEYIGSTRITDAFKK